MPDSESGNGELGIGDSGEGAAARLRAAAPVWQKGPSGVGLLREFGGMRKFALAASAALALAGCATKPPPAPPPAPLPPPAAPVDIVMDAADTAAFKGALTTATARPPDQEVPWSNPASGKQGAVRILRDGFDAGGRPCREFHAVVRLDKLTRHQTGFVCRQPNGAWEIMQARDYPLYRIP